mmetsp:Transcript_46453/g.109131  ORF Transcript_46453/g.109131 Transcript_46453/m.109131 type:complete len:1208 (-) Transcript_46453:95-3718(-)
MEFASWNLSPGPTRPLMEWTVDDVVDFIESTRNKFGDRCDHYKAIVRENDIDGELLADMTEDGLTQLGIQSFGHRHHMMKRIRMMRTGSVNGNGVSTSTPSSGFDTSSNRSQTHMSSSSTQQQPSPTTSNPLAFGGSLPPGIAPYAKQKPQNLVVHDNERVQKSRPAMPRLQQPTPKIMESSVTVGRKIGSGSVGHVYAGTYEQHPVAIKKHRMDGTMMDAKALIEFEIEVGKMTAVNHPCIVRCYGMLEPSPGIVMELVEGGSMFQIIHGERGETFQQYQQRLPWHVRLRYLLDSLYGLRAIHNAGLIHGDFKPLNLLVSHDQRVKVADFGLSKVLDALSVLPGTKTIAGTPQYMAPEVMLSHPHGMRIDVYSVGLVMWEVLTGAIPWKGMDIVQIIQQVTQKSNETVRPPPGRPAVEPAHLQSAPVGFVQLMHECWAHWATDRPDTNTLVNQLESVQKTWWAMVAARPGPATGVNQNLAGLANPMPQHTGGFAHPMAQHPAGFPVAVQPPPEKRARIGGNEMPAPLLFLEAAAVRRRGPHPHVPLLSPQMDGPAMPRPGIVMSTGIAAVPPLAPDVLPMHQQWKPRGGSLNPPPIFLAAGGMKVLVSMLQSPEEKVQLQAVGALSEACNGNPSNQMALGNAGGMQALVQLMRSGTAMVQCKAAAAISAACMDCTRNRQDVIKADGVLCLLELLGSPDQHMQENAATALAVIVKQDDRNVLDAVEEDQRANELEKQQERGLEDSDLDADGLHMLNAGPERVAGQGKAEISRQGGMTALLPLLRSDNPRVKEAAAAAAANAMADHTGNREAFQVGGGVESMLRILKTGDAHAQENATTALWNAMVDNEASRVDIINNHGMPLLIQQLTTGTPIGQELAAGAIWKTCANDPSQKQEVLQAIPGLVKLLSSGTTSAQEQAAGALRSACINSPINKRELNRVNGIAALVEAVRTGTTRCKEQASAALANASANSSENQAAARHAGAIPVLLSLIKNEGNRQVLECAAAALRNLCVACPENQEELNRCGGIQPMLTVLVRRDASQQLLEYTIGALWKACTHSEANRQTLLACGLQSIETLRTAEGFSSEIRRCAEGLLVLVESTKTAKATPPQPPMTLSSYVGSNHSSASSSMLPSVGHQQLPSVEVKRESASGGSPESSDLIASAQGSCAQVTAQLGKRALASSPAEPLEAASVGSVGHDREQVDEGDGV